MMFSLLMSRSAREKHAERKALKRAAIPSSVVFSRRLTSYVAVTVSSRGASRTITVTKSHLRLILEAPNSMGPRSMSGETSDSRYRESFAGTVTFAPAGDETLVVTASALGHEVSAFGVIREGLLADLDALSAG